MPRYNITVKGRVQGVGFRYFVQSISINMNLSGWVKNLDNGNVEFEVENDEEFLDLFLQKLKKGNGFSRIEDLDIISIVPLNQNTKFKIIY
ncbi:MAG: acylphosphatase [Fusobacteriaceae bacterium]|nr:acylphosphatase [Fusobacteriaceae bacterium]